eukprot:CAMPEP_0114566710 /NCGR_PEP_ID=MMETSP0114-20121206/15049_1 /TAXON_ID=31324 /ORGANISM="Goniomonas sp, Strain m" /LENGTH=86 /DNA_ID=CAMNT_0001753163 /DNA_START=480 /DNA_END=736 /DNA_ORIENTATION=-
MSCSDSNSGDWTTSQALAITDSACFVAESDRLSNTEASRPGDTGVDIAGVIFGVAFGTLGLNCEGLGDAAPFLPGEAEPLVFLSSA